MATAAYGARPAGALLGRVAQTNLDLYRQLHRLGHGPAELRRARDAYLLAIELFSDRFRANGKPFVAHLVGTASLLAELGARPDIVIAGLLHAVYANGCFPDGERGMTAAHRALVRVRAGADVELLIAAYEGLQWHRTAIAGIAATGRPLAPAESDILLMRLANEIEDHLALGMRLCGAGRGALAGDPADCIAIARRLGRDELAGALAEVYRDAEDAAWADAIASERAVSFRLPGPSVLTGSEHIRAGLAAARRKLKRLLRWGGAKAGGA